VRGCCALLLLPRHAAPLCCSQCCSTAACVTCLGSRGTCTSSCERVRPPAAARCQSQKQQQRKRQPRPRPCQVECAAAAAAAAAAQRSSAVQPAQLASARRAVAAVCMRLLARARATCSSPCAPRSSRASSSSGSGSSHRRHEQRSLPAAAHRSCQAAVTARTACRCGALAPHVTATCPAAQRAQPPLPRAALAAAQPLCAHAPPCSSGRCRRVRVWLAAARPLNQPHDACRCRLLGLPRLLLPTLALVAAAARLLARWQQQHPCEQQWLALGRASGSSRCTGGVSLWSFVVPGRACSSRRHTHTQCSSTQVAVR
jgi:hypothetical protein